MPSPKSFFEAEAIKAVLEEIDDEIPEDLRKEVEQRVGNIIRDIPGKPLADTYKRGKENERRTGEYVKKPYR